MTGALLFLELGGCLNLLRCTASATGELELVGERLADGLELHEALEEVVIRREVEALGRVLPTGIELLAKGDTRTIADAVLLRVHIGRKGQETAALDSIHSVDVRCRLLLIIII